MNKELQLTAIDILESELSGDLDTHISCMLSAFSEKNLKPAAQVNKKLKAQNMPTELKNNILWWVFLINDPKKPYIANKNAMIVQKLQESNLELALPIDELARHSTLLGFETLLPLLTIENKDELTDALNPANANRKMDLNAYIDKYSK